jgi:hypothetical protein
VVSWKKGEQGLSSPATPLFGYAVRLRGEALEASLALTLNRRRKTLIIGEARRKKSTKKKSTCELHIYTSLLARSLGCVRKCAVGIGNGTPKDYDVIAEMCRGNITFVNGLLQFCGTGTSGSCSNLWFVVMYNCTYV